MRQRRSAKHKDFIEVKVHTQVGSVGRLQKCVTQRVLGARLIFWASGEDLMRGGAGQSG